MECRLSELPEDIIHRIISNLSNKAALRLSLQSKELLAAVQSRPALAFNNESVRDEQELKYLLSTLTRYHQENIHLDTFRFTCLSMWSDANRTHQCIELAAANNLGLKILNISMPSNYVLPKPVFEAKSLVQLELRNCCLKPGEGIITWPNLKRLSLCSVDMEEGVFETIIRGCPLIEFLKIFCRTSWVNFKVSNLGCLKELDILLNGDQTFELGAAPNLECLSCYKGDLRFLGKYEYHELKTMTLAGLRASFNGDFLINLAHQFPVLEDLSICCMKLESINIPSPSLKKIEIVRIHGLQEASFDVPNVVLFRFVNDVVPKLSFAGNSSGWTSRITFRIWNDSKGTSWFLKLKDFCAAINMAEASIHISFDKLVITNFSIEARARKSDVSFPGIIRDLTILTGSNHLASDREILYGILLILRPLRIKIKDSYDCKFPKLVYDHLRFNKANSMTRIEMNRYWTKLVEGSTVNGSWHQVLEQPQVLDHGRFMEMFKVDDDDRNNKFTISFDLNYNLISGIVRGEEL